MNSQTILSAQNLKTCFQTAKGKALAVDDVSFDIPKGKTFAIVGESGCGKTVTALSILRLIQGPAGQISGGKVLFHGSDLLSLKEPEMRKIRGNKISMIFQEPMTSLNPVMTIGEQIMEVTRLHIGLSKKEAREHAIWMLDQVKIHGAKHRISEYPHQLSGGMKQRVMIAMALSCEPELLIADEPTTALDVTIQAQILTLMKELQEKKGTAILIITHDMGVVYEVADYAAVMYAGRIIETAKRDDFFSRSCHPYSVKLFESLPKMNKRQSALPTIPGRVVEPTDYPAGCRFAKRCSHTFDLCRTTYPALREIKKGHRLSCHLDDPPPCTITKDLFSLETKKDPPTNRAPLLSVSGLKIHYPIRRGLFKKVAGYVRAVDGFDLLLKTGETFALVGESGCGKTTVGKGIIKLLPVTKGTIQYNGDDITHLSERKMRKLRGDIQIMFQDPYGSLNPRMMVNQIIGEGLVCQKLVKNRKERDQIVSTLMDRVGLNPSMMYRYPHEFSGGQRQRIGIARFLAVKPKFVVCDEVTSALDVSVQAQILNLLQTLKQEQNLSYLFITHNLSVVSYIADRVGIMYLGRLVEEGDIDNIFCTPKHPYTQALIASSPRIGEEKRENKPLEGEMPSPVNPPTGCHFHLRCPHVMERCKRDYPKKFIFTEDHYAKCWLYE